ncbi:MAG: hypothetical protein HFE47_00230 [Clostridia bacterium]|nr:hypothetical protein [Clostridia bacterium]
MNSRLSFKNSTPRTLFFLMGLFACASSLGIYIGDFGVTFFTIVQMLLVVVTVCFKNIKIKKRNTVLVGYFVFSFISVLINLFVLPSNWNRFNVTTLIAMLFGYGGMYFLFSDCELSLYKKPFIKGLKINIIVQLIWVFLQYALLQTLDIHLNEFVGLYMVKTLPKAQALSGFGWERAELALLFLTGIVLFKSKIIKVIICVAIVLMNSRTALLMLAFLIGGSFVVSRIGFPEKVILFAAAGVITIVVCWLSDAIADRVSALVNGIINFKNDGSGRTHLFYYIELPNLLKSLGIIAILFGFGVGASGYAYNAYSIFNSPVPWTVESTVLANFWGVGIIGFICLYVWLFLQAKVAFKCRNRIFGVYILMIVLGGVLYTLLSNWSMTILIIWTAENRRMGQVACVKKLQQQENKQYVITTR